MLKVNRNLGLPALCAVVLLTAACERPPSTTPDAEVVTDTATAGPRPAADNYRQFCAQCHEGGVPKAPHSIVFQMIGTGAILKSMQDGVMKLQAEPMTAEPWLKDRERGAGRGVYPSFGMTPGALFLPSPMLRAG